MFEDLIINPDDLANDGEVEFVGTLDLASFGDVTIIELRIDGVSYFPDSSREDGRIVIEHDFFSLQLLTADRSNGTGFAGDYRLTIYEGFESLPSFEIVMSDGAGGTIVEPLNVVLGGSGPELALDPASVSEGSADGVGGDVLPGTDDHVTSFTYSGLDGAGQPAILTAAAGSTVTTELGGSLTVNADGTWNYIPPASLDQSVVSGESFEVMAEDSSGNTATGQQTIDVTDVPIAVTTASEAASVSEAALADGTAPDAAGVVASGSFADNFDFGPDGAGLVTNVRFDGVDYTPAAGGSVTVDGGAWTLSVAADGGYDFTLTGAVAHGGAAALDLPTFEVSMNDATGDSAPATTSLTVSIQDDAPVLLADTPASVEAGTGNTVSGNVLANDLGGADGAALVSFTYSGDDGAGTPVTLTAAAGSTVTTELGGSLTVNANGSWSYQAPGHLPGAASVPEAFGYDVADADGSSASGSMTINVTPAEPDNGDNASPLAQDDFIITNAAPGETIVIPTAVLLGNDSDPDGDPLSLQSVGDAVGGSVGMAGDSVTFMTGESTPAPARAQSQNAAPGFTYQVSDGLSSAQASVQISYSDSGRMKGSDGDDIMAGGNENDRIAGKDGDDLISGGGGDDRIYGGHGNDTVYGGDGDDRLGGGWGDDVLNAGDGDDRAYGGDGNDTVYGGDGDDRLGGGAGDDTIDGGDGEDRLSGGWGDDELNAGDGNDAVYGGDGNDTIYGGDGDDYLGGGDGNDTIDGGAGEDRLNGGWGDDELNGGDGDDRAYGGAGDDTITGGDGDDRLGGGWGNDNLDGGDGNDRLNGGWGNDNLDGGDGNDRLNGGWGNDILRGGEGCDRLNGGWSDDALYGGSGNDRLNGGWGDDILHGGEGRDVLFGGKGDDTFVYDSIAEGGDIIRGFDAEDDTIDISGLLASIGYCGHDPVADGYLVLEDVGRNAVQISFDALGRNGADGSEDLVKVLGTTSSDLVSNNSFDIM